MRDNKINNVEMEKSIVLVGLMGAGKTAIGKRLSTALGLPFYDSDVEIERAAGASIAEIFERYGEAHFRSREQLVIERLLAGPRAVLATGGGAFMSPAIRASIRAHGLSVWLRAPLPILLKRVQGRSHRPLLNRGDPAEILTRLMAERSKIYAQADMIVESGEDAPQVTMKHVMEAVQAHQPPRRVTVTLSTTAYDVVIGAGLLARAGALLDPALSQPRTIIVTDEHVAKLHLSALQTSLNEVGIANSAVIVAPGEASKNVATWQYLVEQFLAQKVDRQTCIIALGGGVIGDLAGFAAASTLRGLPFVQIPTSLLAQVDSSVGGKTGINSPHGKNLIGAFHQPLAVLADTAILATLPPRELRAGYAEIVKAGLIADPDLFAWCEANGAAMMQGNGDILAQAVEHAVRFKAAVVGDDEFETKPQNGRALLNLGHTFAHALEAETGYGGALLHGEAVAIGLVLATHLSASLGHCPQEDTSRIAAHLQSVDLPVRIAGLPATNLITHMSNDKKMRSGKLNFVLTRGIGAAFTCADVPPEAVRDTLLANGAV